MSDNVIVVKSRELSNEYDDRFIVVNEITGDVIDDAQGYGYKTKDKAWKAYTYKLHHNRGGQTITDPQELKIKRWLTDNPDIMAEMKKENVVDVISMTKFLESHHIKYNVPVEMIFGVYIHG